MTDPDPEGLRGKNERNTALCFAFALSRTRRNLRKSHQWLNAASMPPKSEVFRETGRHKLANIPSKTPAQWQAIQFWWFLVFGINDALLVLYIYVVLICLSVDQMWTPRSSTRSVCFSGTVEILQKQAPPGTHIPPSRNSGSVFRLE